MGDHMEDYLSYPIQYEYNDFRFGVSTKQYKTDKQNTQSTTLPNGEVIPIYYSIVLTLVQYQYTMDKDIDICEIFIEIEV